MPRLFDSGFGVPAAYLPRSRLPQQLVVRMRDSSSATQPRSCIFFVSETERIRFTQC
jgi:hypothetical protein